MKHGEAVSACLLKFATIGLEKEKVSTFLDKNVMGCKVYIMKGWSPDILLLPEKMRQGVKTV